jgi:hypothetical protein
MKKPVNSPSLIDKRFVCNIDERINKEELYSIVQSIQRHLKEETTLNKREFDEVCMRLSYLIDLMVIKFVYKPTAGNGFFIGYTFLDEILNESRIRCLRAIFEFKFKYDKSHEVFCYLTYTIINACRQIINQNTRQKNIKYNYLNDYLIGTDYVDELGIQITHKIINPNQEFDVDVCSVDMETQFINE